MCGCLIELVEYHLSGAQLPVGRGGFLPCPFLKVEKKCPDFAKKCSDFGKMCPVCVPLWVTILI